MRKKKLPIPLESGHLHPPMQAEPQQVVPVPVEQPSAYPYYPPAQQPPPGYYPPPAPVENKTMIVRENTFIYVKDGVPKKGRRNKWAIVILIIFCLLFVIWAIENERAEQAKRPIRVIQPVQQPVQQQWQPPVHQNPRFRF